MKLLVISVYMCLPLVPSSIIVAVIEYAPSWSTFAICLDSSIKFLKLPCTKNLASGLLTPSLSYQHENILNFVVETEMLDNISKKSSIDVAEYLGGLYTITSAICAVAFITVWRYSKES